MIFYGKASRFEPTAAVLDEIEGWIDEAEVETVLPIERHGAWTAALIAAGGLAQGLADASSEDGEAAALALATQLAAVMGASFDSGFADQPGHRPVPVSEALAALRSLSDLPDEIEIRRPEGFAHYAVYPEAYWRAAARLAAPAPTRVLGLRSIGSTLAPVVAAELRSSPAETVRPEGHPFARTIAVSPAKAKVMREGADAVWAVVDEGPGLSGSSIGAAADALACAGVPPERLVLFPSHDGEPGAMASLKHRHLWSRARTTVCSFEHLWLDRPEHGLAAWVEDITGPLVAPPEDVAGGAWRRHRFADDVDWPAVDRQNERRKYLLTGQNGAFLLRFTGLGRFGRDKFQRATALAEAGFGLEPLGWRHGFLIERWRHDLEPLSPVALDRLALLRRLGDYLAFRARAFPTASGDGASLDALLAMARVNSAEMLGEAAGRQVDGWSSALPRLTAVARPVAIDGRLAAHEWLSDRGGTLLKTDSLDHCCGHDLVGCQDIAWDIAGAEAEYALSDREVDDLSAAVARSGCDCHPDLLAVLRIAYPAFRVGALSMARDRETGAEAERLSAALSVQVEALRRALG